MKYVIGIDIGTQGVKAALYDADGRCHAEAFEPFQPSCPAPGAVEEVPEFQVASASRMVRECVEKSGLPPGEIAALAVAGQMAGVIGIGEDGRAVTPYDSWLDTRCAAWIARLQRDAGADILTSSGNAPSFNHGPKMLWWRETHPEIYRRIRRFVQPGAYTAMRWCGLAADEAFIDPTYLHFSGFADNRAGDWNADLCRRFGLDPDKLPRVVQATGQVGTLLPAMAESCGLPAGVPVMAGCGDTAASFLSCGATDPGICVDVAGTASVFAATTNVFTPDHHSGILGCGQSATPGRWHPYAYINGGGKNLEWFRRELGRVDLAILDGEAAAVELDASLPFFVPHPGGRVSPGWPELRGAWAGLTWDHTRGALYRSLLEAVGLEYALYQHALRQLLPDAAFTELRITGGGEKSAFWNQLKADILGMPVMQIEAGGGAPMGAALIAGMGAGWFDDLSSAAAGWVRPGRRFEPNASRASYYQDRTQRYAALLDSLHDWSRQPDNS